MPARLGQAEQLLRKARITIIVGFVLLFAAVLGVVIGLIRSREADQWVLHTLEVQRGAQAVLIAVRDAESSFRTALLSSDPEDLKPFDGAVTTATTELDNLRRLTADNAAQQARLADLDKLIVTKTGQLKAGIQSYEQGDRDKALAAINTHEARTTLDDIRAQIEAFIMSERDLLAERQARAASLRYGLAILIGVALACCHHLGRNSCGLDPRGTSRSH